MPRVKGGPKARRRHDTVLAFTKGQRGTKSKLFRRAQEAMLKSLTYAYRDRRARKGDMRRLWITRINARAREGGLSYSQFMFGLKQAGVGLDRKILAELAVNDAAAFGELVNLAKSAA